MNLTSDPLFVRAEMAYRHEQALGLVGRRRGPSLWSRVARLRRSLAGAASVQDVPTALQPETVAARPSAVTRSGSEPAAPAGHRHPATAGCEDLRRAS